MLETKIVGLLRLKGDNACRLTCLIFHDGLFQLPLALYFLLSTSRLELPLEPLGEFLLFTWKMREGHVAAVDAAAVPGSVAQRRRPALVAVTVSVGITKLEHRK